MRDSVLRAAFALTALTIVAVFVLSSSCRRVESPPPLVAQLSGTIELAELSAPVRVVRDRWGVPHIYAETQDDLFAAQGFIQAEDRLFQMDLWRRAAQGRLAEVLGPNFVERDAMTRRIQYRGDPKAEWAIYGLDARAIATAFTRGINAWVARARERLPEEFVLAGWTPDLWSPEDLLNRTDAFLDSRDAVEVDREHLNDVVTDTLRRVGAPPFFAGLAAPVRQTILRARQQAAAAVDTADPAFDVEPDRTQFLPNTGGLAIAGRDRVELSEARRQFDHPSTRYLVHLNAPGWSVVGATQPWLPGVAVGHNDRVAWGMTPIDLGTADVYVQSTDRSSTTLVTETIRVKGRASPFFFDCELTPHGVVFASDREHNRVFTVRWSGMQPGAAPSLAALALDRAQTWSDFRDGLARWKMPPRRVVYADLDGNVAAQDAALVPRRQGKEWIGWLTLDDLPHALNPASGLVSAGGPSPARQRQTSNAVFSHVLGVTDAARRRFTIGPLNRPADEDSPVRATFDLGDWDRSRAVNAPGQSEAADSPHFADLAKLWSAEQMFPLLFAESAVQANAEATLVIVPAQRTR